MPSPLPPILDATCGSRMIHFDKDCPDVLYMDRREADGEAIWRGGNHGKPSVRHLNIHPDVIADFTAMPFPDESFWLVVFDPPHLNHIGANAWMAKKYGVLKGNWKQMLRDGFRECMRVLKPGGSLVFKWSEVQIPVGTIWDAIGAIHPWRRAVAYIMTLPLLVALLALYYVGKFGAWLSNLESWTEGFAVTWRDWVESPREIDLHRRAWNRRAEKEMK